MKITLDNWNYCYFKTRDMKAFISMGGMPSIDEEEAQLIYNVTLSDFSHKEMFQKDFINLSDAIKYLEKRYGHWEFENPLLEKESAGCSSCSAH